MVQTTKSPAMGKDSAGAQREGSLRGVPCEFLQQPDLQLDGPFDEGECDVDISRGLDESEVALLTTSQTGYRRQLEPGDLPTINPKRAVAPTTDKMKESFERRLANGDKYPLLWAMHETYFREFWIGGACHLVSALLQVTAPFILRFLIQFATDAYVANLRGLPPPSIGAGLGLVFGVTIMQILQSLGTNHFIYRGMLVGGMARASLISMIYEKSMVISGRAKAGGAELPDIPAAKAAAEIAEKAKTRKGPGGPPGGGPGGGGMGPPGGAPGAGVASDGIGWGNGRVVS
jgi:ATP-binding cassette, subfamily C (CFTR/MRP), member 1